MEKQLQNIMLIDDDSDDNFYHEREIARADLGIAVVIRDTGNAALEYLKSLQDAVCPRPDVIFLDINMPRMNGLEFLEEFNKLNEKTRAGIKIFMLTTSNNPVEVVKAMSYCFVADFLLKPLSSDMMMEIYNGFKISLY